MFVIPTLVKQKQEDPWDLLSSQPGLLSERPVSENRWRLPEEGNEGWSCTPAEAMYLDCHSLKFLLETGLVSLEA